MAQRIKILAIDGGGIRGVIPAMLMAEIERRTGQRIAQLFDLIAGTSTGGILALAATKPAGKTRQPQYAAADMVALYEQEGERIFHRTPWRTIRSLGGVIDELYPSEGVEAVLKEYFGETLLSEALTDVMLPAYEIQRRETFFFKSTKAKMSAADDCLMWQAARATSAAPTYFEPTQVKMPEATYSLVDGGMVANNPAMCAYAEARRLHPEATEFLLVSLGTGDPTRPILYPEAKNWGKVEWLVPLFSIFLDGMGNAVDYQLQYLFPHTEGRPRNYYRLQTLLRKGNDNIDDVSRTNISVLKVLAGDLIDNVDTMFTEMCQQLKE